MNRVTIAAFITTFIILDSSYSGTEAKTFTRCQLAKELLKNDFPRTFLSNWVCLIETESGRNTTKVMQYSNLSASYGLFQINSKLWCGKGFKGGRCDARCESFLDDDIRDDSKCAKLIFNREGFKNWPGWFNKCRGSNLPDVFNC